MEGLGHYQEQVKTSHSSVQGLVRTNKPHLLSHGSSLRAYMKDNKLKG